MLQEQLKYIIEQHLTICFQSFVFFCKNRDIRTYFKNSTEYTLSQN